MKASIYFLSIILSTFLGSIFLMEYPKSLSSKENESVINQTSSTWKDNYSKCEKMIDSINCNNSITKKNLEIVEIQLSELN